MFSSSPASYAAGAHPTSIATGDFNGDGYADMAVVPEDGDDVAILLGTEAGTFQAPYFISNVSDGGLVTGDFNGDGKIDLVGTLLSPVNSVHLLLGNGDGTFQTADLEPVVNGPYEVVAADFNADGFLDVAATRNNPPGFNVFLGDGAGHLTSGPSQNAPTPAGSPNSGWIDGIAVGNIKYYSQSFDRPDVVLIDSLNDRVLIYDGRRDPTYPFALVAPFDSSPVAGHTPRAVATGDFNGDGESEIIVGHQTEGSESGNPLVIIFRRDQYPFATIPFGSLPATFDLLVRDLDGDGDEDIVSVGGGVVVFRNNGVGTFAPQEQLATGTRMGVAAVDVDRDGGTEIAASNFNGDTIDVYKNSCGQVALTLTSSATAPNEVTVTASLSSNAPAATGTLTLEQTGTWTLGQTTVNGTATVTATRTLEPGVYEFTTSYSGNDRYAATTVRHTHIGKRPHHCFPANFRATSTGGAVTLTWVSGSAGIQVLSRRTGTERTYLGTLSGHTESFVDASPPPASAVLYELNAYQYTGVPCPFVAKDLTITSSFTDETITAGRTRIKRAHITELRTATDKTRVLVGLPPYNWTDAVPTRIKAIHLTELRSAINQARAAAGVAELAFRDPVITPQSTHVRRKHIIDLRDAIR